MDACTTKSLSFCTLFDSMYLTRGLSLYFSLEKVCPSFHLYIYCFDDRVFELFQKLKLKNITPISLADFETTELLEAKKNRSRGEYCWTCTPFIIRDALDRFSLSEVTAIDSDTFFFENPQLLINELNAAGGDILLTEHNYSPSKKHLLPHGRFCVQFMTFKNNLNGRTALNWWADRCLEWCYARLENGKFGDQGYLNDWEQRFKGVHVLKHLGGGVAPWNIEQYTLSAGPKVNNELVVFYHFHSLKIFKKSLLNLCQSNYYLSQDAIDLIYKPYALQIRSTFDFLQNKAAWFEVPVDKQEKGFRNFLKQIKRKLTSREYQLSLAATSSQI